MSRLLKSKSRVFVMMSLVMLRSCGNCGTSSVAVACTISPTTSSTSSASSLLKAMSAYNFQQISHCHNAYFMEPIKGEAETNFKTVFAPTIKTYKGKTDTTHPLHNVYKYSALTVYYIRRIPSKIQSAHSSSIA